MIPAVSPVMRCLAELLHGMTPGRRGGKPLFVSAQCVPASWRVLVKPDDMLD